MPDPASSPTDALARSRQKIILLVLATVLMLGGFVVLFALKRMPLHMRLVVGFGDFIAASALLLFLRQKFSDP
ncbi:MAG: hypothetical protein EXS39_05580 [Opitutaceae bacterium]|nr:hypothetical protein [Opitutaceae bacterium]